jgi:hypothetical protein
MSVTGPVCFFFTDKPDHVLFNCYSTGGTEHYGTIPVKGLESLLGKPVKD